MKLDSIRATNFRQYYGDQDAEFSSTDGRNVTVFHGKNGAGKTSLFSAVNWCLYKSGVEDIGELVNKQALSEAENGQLVTCRVMVWFTHQGNRYLASRFLRVKKATGRGLPEGEEFQLTRVKASGDNEKISNPEGQMNAILPANVRTYFFFDGEKMDDLTKAGNKEVESAIRNVMRVEALERAETHLNKIAADYRRKIKREGSAELKEIVSKEEKWRNEKEKSENRLDELQGEISLARQHIEDLNQKLRGSEATRSMQEKRDSSERQLKREEDREKQLLKSIQTVVTRSYPAIMSSTIAKALSMLDEKRERGEIPSGIREQLVRDLLENLNCVCGRPFHEGDDAHEHLISLLGRATSNKLEAEVSNLPGMLRALNGRVEEYQTSLNDHMRERQQIKNSMEQARREMDDVERQLRNAPEEEIAGLERKRSKFQKDLEVYLGERGSLHTRIEQIDFNLKDIDKKKRAAEEKEKKVALLGHKEKLAQDSADAVKEIKKEFFEETRQQIEAWTRSIFSKLAWKQEHFQDVRLDQDFRLEVIDRWGTPTRKELSAGERQILSLSFICAMAQISDQEAPLVMDTPFGRLSGDHLSAVAGSLPELTPQLILFVTDREWDEASSTNLEPRTGAQYELSFSQDTSCTEIKELSYR